MKLNANYLHLLGQSVSKENPNIYITLGPEVIFLFNNTIVGNGTLNIYFSYIL